MPCQSLGVVLVYAGASTLDARLTSVKANGISITRCPLARRCIPDFALLCLPAAAT